MTQALGKAIVRRGLNEARYVDMLTEVRPTLPRTVKENRRLLAIVGPLLDKDSPTPEESALAEVLVTLIHRFEQDYYKPVVSGNNAAIESDCAGALAQPLAELPAGTQISVRMAIFFHFHGGKIVGQTDYMCYDPIGE